MNTQQTTNTTTREVREDIPESIRKILEDKRKYLISQKYQIQQDINEIDKFLGGK